MRGRSPWSHWSSGGVHCCCLRTWVSWSCRCLIGLVSGRTTPQSLWSCWSWSRCLCLKWTIWLIFLFQRCPFSSTPPSPPLNCSHPPHPMCSDQWPVPFPHSTHPSQGFIYSPESLWTCLPSHPWKEFEGREHWNMSPNVWLSSPWPVYLYWTISFLGI